MHADHITSAEDLKQRIGGAKGIGEGITQVQQHFKKVFNFDWLKTDASQFDFVLKDNQVIKVGDVEIKTINTPGHTPDSVTYVANDKCMFVGGKQISLFLFFILFFIFYFLFFYFLFFIFYLIFLFYFFFF